MTNRSVIALLDALIDYAGLFPPAGLGMREAVRNYATNREGPYSWALARFICPASRLRELHDEWLAARELLTTTAKEPLRVAALVISRPELEAGLEAIAHFHDSRAGIVDMIEIKAASVGDIEAVKESVPKGIMLYFELAPGRDLPNLIGAVSQARSRAKIRTGGVTPDAFPSAAQIVEFIATCARAGVPFKATAGLHHPLRCIRPLTYAPDSPTGTMHGFANVFLAATLLRDGTDHDLCIELLEERDAGHFAVTDDGITWRNHFITSEAIAETRRDFAISFGSCSFEEPIDDLRALDWHRPES